MSFDVALKHGQSKRFTEKINSTRGKEQRAAEENEAARARMQPGAGIGGLPAHLAESQVTSSDLQEERNMIEKKLEEVKMSDLDERSDFQFSQMPSHVGRLTVTTSEVGAIPKPTTDKANNQKPHS